MYNELNRFFIFQYGRHSDYKDYYYYPGYQRFSRGTLGEKTCRPREGLTSGEAARETCGKEHLDLPCWMDLYEVPLPPKFSSFMF